LTELFEKLLVAAMRRQNQNCISIETVKSQCCLRSNNQSSNMMTPKPEVRLQEVEEESTS
jgi:hypothetical protein